ncbi:DUF2508 family protein [Paenibacillus segetis]|uniref:DUF2508 domain-containing protein n=1 Tax=Paenibacillus segetis TaxID=1325360 RepID=A0ABQ1YY63_9BACL|nr:DUF2508 family protein [Paenibacillus segetis]GGH40745.1 hypothetical protein GCM10008013_50390 [Paenibacillus segetis]
MGRWRDWFTNKPDSLQAESDFEYKRYLYEEVNKAREEWERAYQAFQRAAESDEVDVAIYTLEAAERRYQIQLKAAKAANLNWDIFKQG